MQDKQYRDKQHNDQDLDSNVQLAVTEQNSEISIEDYYKQTGKLPPRHVKHSKKHKGKPLDQIQSADEAFEDKEEEEREPKRKRSFPFIQIFFYAFLACIIFFYAFWFYQERQQEVASTPTVDPFQNFINQGNQQNQQEEPPQTETKDENTTSGGATEGATSDAEVDGAEELDQISDTPIAPKPSDDDAVEPKDEENDENQNHFSPEILTEHIIQPNETMFRISMHYYGDAKYVEPLAKYNGIEDIREIRSGMMLIIPKLAN